MSPNVLPWKIILKLKQDCKQTSKHFSTSMVGKICHASLLHFNSNTNRHYKINKIVNMTKNFFWRSWNSSRRISNALKMMTSASWDAGHSLLFDWPSTNVWDGLQSNASLFLGIESAGKYSKKRLFFHQCCKAICFIFFSYFYFLKLL